MLRIPYAIRKSSLTEKERTYVRPEHKAVAKKRKGRERRQDS